MFPFDDVIMKLSSVKRRPFCPGANDLKDYINATGAIIWLGECHVLPCETTNNKKSVNGEINKRNFKKSYPLLATNRISGVTYSHHAEKAILFWPLQCRSCNIGIDEYFVACQLQIIPRRSIGFPMTALVCLGFTQFDTLRPKQIDVVSQTTFSSAFSWKKMSEFRLKFHSSLFIRVQLTIFQHCFRYWFGADQATSHYLKQW